MVCMPFECGEEVYAFRLNQSWQKAEVLAVRKKSETKDEYFLHYDGFNRRLDEWVSHDRLKSRYDFENQKTQNGHDSSMIENFNNRKITRNQKRKYNEMNHISLSYSEMDPTTAALEQEYAEKTKVKYIDKIEIGEYLIDTWYYSPYPDDYETLNKLFICEKCLKYMKFESSLISHIPQCDHLHPPGNEIYASEEISVFEVDGNESKLYCQNLCLLAKMFLDHKTLYYDVSTFLFYVLVEKNSSGFHIAAYFSKEKESVDNHNVSCILALPPYQRKGYGKFLISLSYEISKFEGKPGTPEKPLSDLGHLTYRSYWTYMILDQLRQDKNVSMSINDLCVATGIAKNDVLETLQLLNLLKYWKGNYVVCCSPKMVDDYLKTEVCKPPRLVVDPSKLRLTLKSSPF